MEHGRAPKAHDDALAGSSLEGLWLLGQVSPPLRGLGPGQGLWLVGHMQHPHRGRSMALVAFLPLNPQPLLPPGSEPQLQQLRGATHWGPCQAAQPCTVLGCAMSPENGLN